ncbi:MAG: monovalent cation:proton antiporter-2 (CPA2) family protein [Alphaproteobacteria bacterium]|nr:monovalent cation:proton antiporter-2 (CPA2) family protein [Alphaproteobacteria bacterium]
MTLNQFLISGLVYLAATVISAPLSKRLGIGSVLGFLVAGVVIGPSAFNLVGDNGETVKHFAEFGVIMMLFLIGLELEPSKLWDLRGQIFGLGALQVIGVSLALAAAALLVVPGWREAVVVGIILSLSSTAIVMQGLEERGLAKTPVGQSVFSVLLFQDISVIPILAVLPLLAIAPISASAETSSLIAAWPTWLQAIAILVAVAAITLGGRFLTRPLFRMVADTGAREIFVATALLLVIVITLIMGMVGLSAALGTFLAGVVLADSEYRHELEMDLQPFKGLLLAIFFIAVGSGVDFKVIAAEPFKLVAALVAFIALKYVAQIVLARVFRMDWAQSTRFSAALSQASEFGFVLVGVVVGLGLISATLGAAITAVIVLSMAAAPLLMILDDRIVQPWLGKAEEAREADVITHDGVDAIIAGHGRFGMTIGRVLGAQGLRLTLLDHDSSQVDALRKFGFKVFYGDALRTDLLEAAGAREAKILVIAIDDRDKVLELVKIAQHEFPHLKLFARAYDRVHAADLMKMGVKYVYRELFGSSMYLARDALIELGQSPTKAQSVMTKFAALDRAFLEKSVAFRGNETALVDLARESRAEIARVFEADRDETLTNTKGKT